MRRTIRRTLAVLAIAVVAVPTGAHAATETIAPPFDNVHAYEYAPTPLILNRSTTSASSEVTEGGLVDLASSVENRLGGNTVFFSTTYAYADAALEVAHTPGTAEIATYTVSVHINSATIEIDRKPQDIGGGGWIYLSAGVYCDFCGTSGAFWDMYEEGVITDEDVELTLEVDGGGAPIGDLIFQVYASTNASSGLRQGSFSATLDAEITSIEATY